MPLGIVIPGTKYFQVKFKLNSGNCVAYNELGLVHSSRQLKTLIISNISTEIQIEKEDLANPSVYNYEILRDFNDTISINFR